MCIQLIGAALAVVLTGQDPEPAALRQGLAGQWVGALGYRDYQTDQLVELPVKTEIRLVGDGVSSVSISQYDDGPSGVVYITSAALDDVSADTVTTTTLREGRAMELTTEAVRLERYVDPTHWTLVYSWRGEDDDKPADLRVTQTRDGDALLSIKDVRLDGQSDWAFRNQTRLSRIP